MIHIKGGAMIFTNALLNALLNYGNDGNSIKQC